jgi:hypothetical protein
VTLDFYHTEPFSRQTWLMIPPVLLEIIDFKERCVRQQQISGLETTPKTLKWIWTSSFKTWLEDDTPFFWISGKPASGKSTLMNYIAQAGETTETAKRSRQGVESDLLLF